MPDIATRPIFDKGFYRVAVLLASHNRLARTVECLTALKNAQWPEGVRRAVFLVDDGSTDGTAVEVAKRFPDVKLIHGTGALYWCNSMRLAWEHAAKGDYDFYLWTNDDTTLRPEGLVTLFATWKLASSLGTRDVVVVGSCCDPVNGRHTYGGLCRPGRHPARLVPVEPDEGPQPCDTFNGNLVLVPRSVFRKIGNMRPFAHAIGDNDYGLRARAAGCDVIVAPGYQGECGYNSLGEQFAQAPLLRRISLMFGPKIFPPLSWFRYYWTHAGLMSLVYWPVSCVRHAFPGCGRGYTRGAG